MNTLFICPVCRTELKEDANKYFCEKGHCFDKAKSGYVNLLMSGASSGARHGDDKLMLRARRDFLNRGYYSFLREEIINRLKKHLPANAVFLDAGCGEGYYTDGIINAFPDFSAYGIDISKDAADMTSKQNRKIKTAVASVYSIPCHDGAFDGLINIFSPEAFSEYRRVLKQGGILLRVVPQVNHLMELKEKVYNHARPNDEIPETIEGFELTEKTAVTQTAVFNNNTDIINLFKMTPYYYKTSADDQNKLNSLDSLTVTLAFDVRVYKKL